MRHLNIFEFQVLIDMGIALPVNAGDADADHIVGAQHSPGGLSAGKGEQRKRSAGRNGLS